MRFVKWLGRLLTHVIILLSVLILLPWASKMAALFLPDFSGMAVNTSIVLSQKLTAASRLETNRLDIEGVLDSSVNALLIGTVQNVKIAYDYHASIGIDLQQVQIHVIGKTLTIELPDLIMLSDSLTPTDIVRNDFWYPLTDERRMAILDAEKTRLAAEQLSKLNDSQEAWQNTIAAFEKTIGEWIKLGSNGLTIQYIKSGENV